MVIVWVNLFLACINLFFAYFDYKNLQSRNLDQKERKSTQRIFASRLFFGCFCGAIAAYYFLNPSRMSARLDFPTSYGYFALAFGGLATVGCCLMTFDHTYRWYRTRFDLHQLLKENSIKVFDNGINALASALTTVIWAITAFFTIWYSVPIVKIVDSTTCVLFLSLFTVVPYIYLLLQVIGNRLFDKENPVKEFDKRVAALCSIAVGNAVILFGIKEIVQRII